MQMNAPRFVTVTSQVGTQFTYNGRIESCVDFAEMVHLSADNHPFQ